VRLSTHGTGWHKSDIDRWIADPAGWRADDDNADRAENVDIATPADVVEPGGHLVAANDNVSMDGVDPETLRKVNAVVMRIARLIGRRMAREDFAALMVAANDNLPKFRTRRRVTPKLRDSVLGLLYR
jgi:hypothetical protein